MKFIIAFIVLFSFGCSSVQKQEAEKIEVKVELTPITDSPQNTVNQLLEIAVKLESQEALLFQDSIYSKTGTIERRDFNGDSIQDVLIQNISDARSNWTYNLYLITPKDVKKVKGFSHIKNPTYLKQGFIQSHVMSGKNYYEFYSITETDTLKSYDLILYGNETNDVKHSIDSILKVLNY
jgi:hypothetical protein